MKKKRGYLKAAKTYNLPRQTLFRLSKSSMEPEKDVLMKLGRKTVLGDDLENELVKYVLEMEVRFYGLRRMDLRRMAYQVAHKNNIQHPFGKCEVAGRAWLDLFLARHKDKLSIRKPTGTSFARAAGFNRDSVAHFFNILEGEFEKNNYPPHRIYNVDESGLTIVQSRDSDLIGLRGKIQIASLTSAERGALMTVIICMRHS